MAANEAKVTFLADTREFRDNIKEAKSSITEINSEIKLLDSQMKTGGESFAGLTDKADLLSKRLEEQQSVTQNLSEELEAAKRIYGESSTEVERLQTQLNNSLSAQEQTKQQIAAVNEQLENMASQSAQAESATGQLTQTIAEQEQQLSALKEQYTEAVLKYGETSDEAQNLAQQITAVSGELQGNKTELQNASEAADKFDQSMSDAGTNGVSAIENISAALSAAGISKLISEAAEAALGMAESYSDASANIVEGTGASGEALRGLQTELYNAYYRVTDSEASLESLGNVLAEINTRFGYTGQTLSDTTVLISEFAEHTGTDAVGAVDSLADVTRKWQLDESEMAHLIDALTVANQSCSLSVDEMTGYLTNNKAQFDELGYSVDEAIAFMVSMADSGVNVSSVMTGMRSGIAQLSQVTNDVPGTFAGMITAISQCKDVSSALSIEVGDTGKTVQEVFGNRAAQEMVTAIQSGNFAIGEWTDKIRTADGALQTTATNANTVSDAWATASRNITGAFSQALAPAIEKVSTWLAGLVTTIGQFLQEHPKLTTAIAAIAAAFGTLLGISAIITIVKNLVGAFQMFSTVVSIVKGVGTAISGLFTILAANPIGAIVAAIAALVAGIVLLWNKCEGFRNAVTAIWEAIKGAFVGAANAIKSVWQGVVSFFSGVWQGIQSVFSGVKEFFSGIFSGAASAVVGIWNGIKSAASTVWNGITSVISSATSAVTGTVEKVWNAAKSGVSTIWNGIKNTASTVWNGIKDTVTKTVTTAKEKVTTVWNSAKDAVSKTWNTLKQNASTTWNAIKDAAVKASNEGKGPITAAWEGIKAGIKTQWDKVPSIIRGPIDTVRNYLSSAWTNIKDTASRGISNVVTTITGIFKELPGKIKEIGSNLIMGLWNGIKEKATWVIDKVKGIGKSIIDGIKGVFGVHSPSTVFQEIGENLDYGLANGVINERDSVIRPFNDMLATIRNADITAEWDKLNAKTPDLAFDVSARMGENMENTLNSNSGEFGYFTQLIDAIYTLATRAVEIYMNDRLIATATAGAADSVNGTRLNFKNRGLAI